METKSFGKEFLNLLELLSTEQQLKVLTYGKSLVSGNQSQHQLLEVAGSLDDQSIREMTKAIESDGAH